MNRRTFLWQSAAAGAVVVSGPNLTRASEHFDLTEEVGHSVIEFIDDDWAVAELEEAMSDTFGTACDAYGKFETVNEEDPDQDPGYLERLGSIGWEELNNNPEAYNWVLDYVGKITDFVASLGVFSDQIRKKLDAVTEKAAEARKVTKFIPLIWSVKSILDVGCRIHHRLENHENVSMDTYIGFFKHIALATVNIVLLATGTGLAYKVAWKATGSVNNLLINIVGQRIGWEAYSWLLSLVHWGVRIVFAGGMGEAITNSTEAVVGELVEASSLSREEATEMASEDVRLVAKHADSRGLLPDFGYELWNLQRKLENGQQEALEHADRVTDGLPV